MIMKPRSGPDVLSRRRRDTRWAIPILLLLLLPCARPTQAAGNAIQASLHNFFRQGVVLAGAHAELVKVLRWPDVKQNAKRALRWHLPHLRDHPERVSLIAEQGRGANTRRWYVPVRLRWWVNAVAVRDDIAAHTLLTASSLQYVRANVAGHVGRWWTDTRQLIGTRTTRPLRARQVIYESYVRRPPLLMRGDRIALLASIGGVRVTATGEVLKRGGRGDRVPVRNLSSRRVLQAIVVDRYTARVLVGGG